MADIEIIDVELELEGTPIQGPAGPQGIAGPAGSNGVDGIDGKDGINGINGQNGSNGAIGLSGPQGPAGPIGPIGPAGDDGAVGPAGPAGAASTVAGPQGPRGDQGATGPQGPQGVAGPKGEAGTNGATGPKGDAGTNGTVGPQGPKGESGTGLNNKGDWVAATYQPGDYVFAAGTTSDTSMWILRGTVPFVSANRPNIDLAHWIEFEAPAGQDGAVGPQGPQGPAGTAGAAGAKGDTGTQGIQGIQGVKGDTGTTGTKGDQGIQGIQGIQGTAGTAGTNGATWLSGTVAPAAGTGVNGDFYLNTTSSEISKKAAGAWTVVMTISGSGGGGSGTTWIIGTTSPVDTDGANGNLHLQTNTGAIRQKAAGTWNTIITIPLLATTAQAKAALSATIAATPAGVREFMEQFGLASTFTNQVADLDTISTGSFFNWSNTTTHTPVASSYGRGINIPSGGGYQTQIAIENTSKKIYTRVQENYTWGTWLEIGAGGSATLPIASATVLGGIKVGTGLTVSADGTLAASGGGGGGALPIGGTVGQVLTKTGAADGAAGWATPAAGGGGGADPAVYRTTRPTNVVLQQNTPVIVITAPITAGRVYKFNFRGVINDSSPTAAIRFGIGSIGKQDLEARFTYRDNTGVLQTGIVLEGDDGGALGSYTEMTGSHRQGAGNFLTCEGLVTCSSTGTLKIMVWNAVNPWEYRQFSPGCALEVINMGTWTY